MGTLSLLRLPETDDELWLVVKAMWGVSIPREKVCPDHVAPFTAFADAYFRRNSLDPDGEVQSMALWHGSRGLSGKSYLLAILGLTVAYLLGSDVNLLGGSFAQSTNIHQHMREAMDSPNAPRFMVMSEGMMEIKLSNHAKIRPLTASQRTVRGPHPATLLLDEIDEMDLSILDAALGQPMPQISYLSKRIKPYTVMCSTWQHPEGTFTEIMRRAEERHIPTYAWCFLETSAGDTGWLSQDTIEEKRQSIPAEMWRVEYELGEPAIGNRAIDTQAVDAAFCIPFDPDKEPAEGGYVSKKVSKDLEEYTFAEYVKGGEYVAAADWGKEQDKTVIWVARVDTPKRELVYYMRVNRRPYPMMIGWYNQVLHRYDVGYNGAWHDSTGLGNVVNDYLDMRARPFPMTGDKRAIMLSDYVNAIEKGTWALPRIKSAYLEMKYCRVGDLYKPSAEIQTPNSTLNQSARFHLPDTMCAGALAEYAANRLLGIALPIVIKRDETPTRHQAQFLPQPGTEEQRVVSEAPISLLA
jgi:hypothetical protein